MRRFLIICIGIAQFTLVGEAQAKTLDQDSHRRINFVEDWTGYYSISTYIKSLDSVRFDACENSNPISCHEAIRVPYTKLRHLDGPMLEMLKTFRTEVAEKADSSFWYFLSRGSKKSRDVQALDQIIREIDAHGLAHWVMLTDENIQQDPPALSTPDFARELMARMKKVMASEPLTNPSGC